MTGAGLGLESIGWDSSWRETAASYDVAGEPGRVSRVDRGLSTVLTTVGPVRASFGGAVLDAMAADSLATPCTGDWCLVRHWCDGPVTIEAVLPRRTAVVRADPSRSSRGQALAANIDVVGVVAALHPEPNIRRIERLLALAWESGAEPIVVLTKADLVSDADQVAEDVAGAASGLCVLCTSTETGAGVDRLRDVVGVRGTLALIGASGHGKSSLVNALAGADVLHTTKLRDDGKGRHASVRRELVLLPGSGAVIDTPGLRSVGLHEVGPGLASTFRDIDDLSRRCRFIDCAHETEPGCAVLAAVTSGALSVRRLESWHQLRREAAAMAARSDARRRAEQHKRWKELSKQVRTSHRRG
ncbi:MAG: ribosome small subunit-dependent GTPase A [Nocardioidaceae bacterium]